MNEDRDYHEYYQKDDMPDQLDDLTRHRMKVNSVRETDHAMALAFILGTIFGIILASFLHKFIVHPLGW